MISVDFIKSQFDYDRDSGIVKRKATGGLGSKTRNHRCSYITFKIHIDGKKKNVFAHRIAWVLHYGEWPKGQIDHIDGNGLNNRLVNLRDVSHAENQRNQKLHSRNKSGYRGVSLDRKTGKWQAHIWANGKRLYLGRFDTALAAGEARTAAETKYWV